MTPILTVLMLPKENRLNNKKDFSKIYRFGRRVKTGHLLVSYRQNQLKDVRVGIVISKKVAAKSNRRNYLKRVLRVASKQLLKGLKISYDLIITVTRDPHANDQKRIKLLPLFEREIDEISRRIIHN